MLIWWGEKRVGVPRKEGTTSFSELCEDGNSECGWQRAPAQVRNIPVEWVAVSWVTSTRGKVHQVPRGRRVQQTQLPDRVRSRALHDKGT